MIPSLLFALLVAGDPAPVVLAPLQLHGTLPAQAPAELEKGLRDGFTGSEWTLATSADREAQLEAAKQPGAGTLKAAQVMLSCSVVAMGPSARLDCKLVRAADNRILWSERAACSKDLAACGKDLALKAVTRLRLGDGKPLPKGQ
ncbi:MAG: hypothetical protein IT380_19870 [Myxococcales bacterium]|nr:hypothetical protein [Myxococcales bacterium]